MKVMNDYFDGKSSEDSAEELSSRSEKEGILTVTLCGTPDAKERRKRREIANSNERRRMQSINAGFQMLRSLLPLQKGDKMSKATILQQTAEHICNLERDKSKILSQNCQLKRLLNVQDQDTDEMLAPVIKRLKSNHEPLMVQTNIESSSSDDGLGPMSPGSPPVISVPRTYTRSRCSSFHCTESVKQDLVEELQTKLQRERSLRVQLQDQLRNMDPNLFYQAPDIHHVEEVIVSNNNCGDDKVIKTVPKSRTENDIEFKSDPGSPAEFQPLSTTYAKRENTPPLPSEIVEKTSVLESVLKSEPKVKVEVESLVMLTTSSSSSLSPSASQSLSSPSNRLIAPTLSTLTTNATRQNLETIVEAIRHLEGDMFSDNSERFLNSSISNTPSVVVQRVQPKGTEHKLQSYPQQQRPGVIVIQQHS